MGVGIALLHYVGQPDYLVQRSVHWNLALVAGSILVSLPISGPALIILAHRDKRVRKAFTPLSLLSIEVLRFCGMAAMTLLFDPKRVLPRNAVLPETIMPVVASVCLSLLALAVLGCRLDLAAKASLRRDRQRLRYLAVVALERLLIYQDNVTVTTKDGIERLFGTDASRLAGAHYVAIQRGC